MASDTELERLAEIQQAAFAKLNVARDDMNQAQECRAEAQKAVNGAWEIMQNAKKVQQYCRDNLEATRQSLGRKIEALRSEADSKHTQMCNAFAAAPIAFRSGDKSGAKEYSYRGKSLRLERDRLNAQVRSYTQRIKQEQAIYTAAEADLESKLYVFREARAAHDREKANYGRLKAAYDEAKKEAEQAKQAFHARLAVVRAERDARRVEYRRIAKSAGVPHQYLDDIRVRQDTNGGYNIYFGGEGTPDGDGHGHYAVDASGHVTYRRNPLDPHGAHNYSSVVAADTATP